MKTLFIRLTMVMLALPLVAVAQGQTGDWYVAPSIVYFDDDPDRAISDGVSGGQVQFGLNITQYITLEGLLGYHDIDGWFQDETHLDISANVLAFYDRRATFAPYLIAGIGYLGVDFEDGGDENRPSATAGLGFKWRMGQSRFSIRGEARARLAYEEDYNFTDYIVSLGVQYNFGGKQTTWFRMPGQSKSAPTANQDTDGDGVLDMWDECPDTPRGTQVTSRGCELRNIDRDSDGDRVFDHIDQCPNTPSGVPVSPNGCALDSDGDGVTTDRDRCPASSPGAVVDEFGCEHDDDHDGVLNHLDKCPNTRSGARVDVNGCEFTDIIDLPGVNFGAGSDLLLPGTEAYLKFAADTLNNHPDLQVEVAGHTDGDGSAELNRGLSERRAKTVRDHLIRFGVAAERLTAVGYGESEPVADNETIRGRAANRRVELRIVNR